MTRISFVGMKEIPGKNPMYRYKVEQDESNSIEVAPSDDLTETESEETATDYGTDDNVGAGETVDDYQSEEGEDDPEDEEPPVDEVPPVKAAPPARKNTAAAPSPAAQKKVQDILNRRRTTAA